MAKTADLYARIEPDIKEQAESSNIVDANVLSDAEMNAELEKGYADMKAGRVKTVQAAFADIRKEYGQ